MSSWWLTAEIQRVQVPPGTLSLILEWIRTANPCITSLVFYDDIAYHFGEVVKYVQKVV
ncbi:hypothetical protein ABQ286_12255 [Lacticaseibacillus rhamnosus]|uniref:Uncharacterized protein n=1 Tax=Lacticaseibacillus rhamnosus (strain ATCC 53103 / LMG 18243 / GG) TaxID=568703 RepID=A0A809N241_LACRG|nr:hypothetical protein [Lacticaseibacillus rhamnosus]ASY47881.1 hypothetical protein N507_0696 [Lacticaseibacillus rhamnosus DSM 14870]BAI42417.1 hypothetical protein LRHM_1890 [Lacticaseibacillus rhamnosus GG]CAR87861.1 Putative protein without homology [Lacticaseibacillus rhamnosus GG]